MVYGLSYTASALDDLEFVILQLLMPPPPPPPSSTSGSSSMAPASSDDENFTRSRDRASPDLCLVDGDVNVGS